MANSQHKALYSITKKAIMSITGLFLLGFLVIHLLGNLFLFAGPVVYNEYAKTMGEAPFILILEIVLAIGFLFHIIDGIVLAVQNYKARGPKRYKKYKAPDNVRSGSRWMIWTGSVVFIFLVIHLQTFFVPHKFDLDGGNLYGLVLEAFANPLYSLFYVVAVVLLGFHLNHGFLSAFRSLGLSNKSYISKLQGLAVAIALIFTIGFASMPIYFFILSL